MTKTRHSSFSDFFSTSLFGFTFLCHFQFSCHSDIFQNGKKLKVTSRKKINQLPLELNHKAANVSQKPGICFTFIAIPLRKKKMYIKGPCSDVQGPEEHRKLSEEFQKREFI